MARVFELDPAFVTLESSPDSIANWDSLGHLRLIMDLEAEFAVAFSTADIPTLLTVDIICDTIAEYRAA
jgi:acyl carrier protein